MGWKLPRRNRTDQGKQFDRMNPTEKATEFDASHADPAGYAARNFTGQEPTRDAQRIAGIDQREAEREARRQEIIEQSEQKRQQGRHRR